MATTAFSFGGTALSTLGKVTLMDDYLGSAGRRGGNQVIPFRHGTVFAQKYFDERKMIFGLAVTAASATALETAFDTMTALFALRTEQTLSMTREDGTIRTAQATVDAALDVTRKTNTLALVVVEFVLARPYFRLSTLYQVTSDAIDGTPTPQTLTVVNSGSCEERDPTLTLTGPLRNPVITNTTTGVSLTYTGTIASPRVVTISTNSYNEYVATDDLGANKIGLITHSGSAALMTLNPGNNAITIADADYASGTVKFAYYPPFL